MFCSHQCIHTNFPLVERTKEDVVHATQTHLARTKNKSADTSEDNAWRTSKTPGECILQQRWGLLQAFLSLSHEQDGST